MIRVVPSLLILLLLCPPALTQSVVDLPPGERTTQSQSPVAVLTNQDVLNMTKAKLAPEIIIAKIQTSDCNFDTSPSELQRLKGESVPDEIIVAMINAPKADKSSGGAATETNQPAPIKIPAGTLVEIEAVRTVVSSDIDAGSAISFTVVSPVKIDGVIVIAAGALATGRVLKAKRGGRWGRAGQLAWSMQDVEAVDGTKILLQFTRHQKGDSKAGTVTTGVTVANPDRSDWFALGLQARRRRVHFGG